MNPGYFLTCHGSSSDHQNCHCASGSPEDTSALYILIGVGALTFRFSLQVNCLTNLFCVTSACQSPDASYLGEAHGLEWGGSPQLEEIMKKLTARSCLLTTVLGCVASSLLMELARTCHSYSIISLVCRWKGPRSDVCLAKVRRLFLTLPFFRNNALCGIPYQWICGQIRHFGRLKTCINLSYSIPGLKLKFVVVVV